MGTFEKWGQLANKNCTVFIEHVLFDKQQYDCEALQVIDDDERIGVVIKRQELFVYKQNIKRFSVYENSCKVSDGMLTITIVNKM
jgi:hypothetical protein